MTTFALRRFRRGEVITIRCNCMYSHGGQDPHSIILPARHLLLTPSKVGYVIAVVVNSEAQAVLQRWYYYKKDYGTERSIELALYV